MLDSEAKPEAQDRTPGTLHMASTQAEVTEIVLFAYSVTVIFGLLEKDKEAILYDI